MSEPTSHPEQNRPRGRQAPAPSSEHRAAPAAEESVAFDGAAPAEPGPADVAGSGGAPVYATGVRQTAYGRRASDGIGRGERTRPPDRALGLLLLAAERDVRIAVTVSVNGVVVTGTLVGTLAYFRALADQFTSDAGSTEMDEVFADAFRDLVDDAAGVAGGDRRWPPDPASYEQSVSFLHLMDARYVGSAGLLPHGRNGVLFRCPVMDVTGWSVGDLIPR